MPMSSVRLSAFSSARIPLAALRTGMCFSSVTVTGSPVAYPGRGPPMRVVVTGATGNVGTSLVRALGADERVREIVGISRRGPQLDYVRTTWVQLDVEADRERLPSVFEGADAVVHLAWLIQPS